MKRGIFVILAIVVMALFIGGLTGCIDGGGGGDNDTTVNVGTDGSSDNPESESDNNSDGNNPADTCQNTNPEVFDVDDTYSVKNVTDPWQIKIPHGQTFFYIEKVEPEELNCAGDAFLVKVKLAYRTGWNIHDFEKGIGFYVPKSWRPADGSPLKISGIFPEFDFNHQWAPEPPSGTGSYKTLWAGYSKRPTRATAIADCKSPAYYVDPENWQWKATNYFFDYTKGEGIIIEVLKTGKVKAISAVGSELVDIDCQRGIDIPSDWKPADGNPVDMRYVMSGRWAGYGDPDFYQKSWAPEPPDGSGDFKTLWAIY